MSFDGQGAMGGAVSGAMMGAQFGGPWGALAGGAIGGLAGGFLGGSGDTGPSKADLAQAEMLRRDYARYTDTYQPLEDYMFGQLAGWDQKTLSNQNAAMQRSDNAYEQTRESYDRNNRGLGIKPTAEQEKSVERSFDISAALSAVNAANTTGEQMEGLKYGLQGGYGPYRPGGG